MKERNITIDILKVLAAFFITNCHLSVVYQDYPYLGRGTYEGNYLFFFCSGFLLYTGRYEGIAQFSTWYKKKLSRIYPTLLAAALLNFFFLKGPHESIWDILIADRYWFVQSILVQYILLYFIASYFKGKELLFSILTILASAFFTYGWNLTHTDSIWDSNSFIARHLLSFSVLLIGAHFGSGGGIFLRQKTLTLLLI